MKNKRLMNEKELLKEVKKMALKEFDSEQVYHAPYETEHVWTDIGYFKKDIDSEDK